MEKLSKILGFDQPTETTGIETAEVEPEKTTPFTAKRHAIRETSDKSNGNDGISPK